MDFISCCNCKAIFHNAFGAPYDIMGCGMRCMVSGTTISKARRDIYWICWKVPVVTIQLIPNIISEDWIKPFSCVYFRQSAELGTWSLFELVLRRSLGMDIWSTSAQVLSLQNASMLTNKVSIHVFYWFIIIYCFYCFVIDASCLVLYNWYMAFLVLFQISATIDTTSPLTEHYEYQTIHMNAHNFLHIS